MPSLAIAIVWCVLQVSLLCVAGGVLYLVVRTLDPRLGRTSVTALLVLVTLLSLAAVSPWPSWGVLARAAPAERQPIAAALEAASGARDESVSERTQDLRTGPRPVLLQSEFWSSVWNELNRPSPQPQEAASGSAHRPAWHWSATVMMLLAAMMAIGSLRLLAAFVSLRRLRHSSVPVAASGVHELLRTLSARYGIHSAEVRQSPDLHSAATMGWRRPVILLPEAWRQWPEEELRAVLAHEIAHIQARDWPRWLLAQFAVTLHFYHPLVHWLAHRLRLEQELAADAAAAAVTGSKDAYLGTLAAQLLRTDNARLAWAAFTNTFLPTRSTIVRRIEMLRAKSPRLLTGSSPARWRWPVTAAILALGMVAAGVRLPQGGVTPAAQAQERVGQRSAAADAPSATANPGESTDRMDLVLLGSPAEHFSRFADPDAVYFAYVRPRSIFERQEMAPLRVQFNQLLAESRNDFANLKLEELEAVAVAPYFAQPDYMAMRLVLSFSRPAAETAFRPVWGKYQEVERVGEHRLLSLTGKPWGAALLSMGDITLVFDESYERLKAVAGRLGADSPVRPQWIAEADQSDRNAHLWLAVNMDLVRREFVRATNLRPVEPLMPWAMLSPLVEKPKTLSVAGAFAPNLRIEAVAACGNDEDATQVAKTADALVTLARNLLAEQRKTAPPQGTPQAMITGTIEMADQVLQHARVAAVGKEARLQIAAGAVSQQLIQMGLVLPALQSARQAARLTQSTNNLRQLAIAMLTYEDAYGHLPPPVVIGPDGITEHSWRVAVLPFLGGNNIYDEYRFTEPWDSEHNLKLLERMPDVFRSPTEPPGNFNAAYYVLVGEETIFTPDGGGTKFSEITDGTSNTFMIVEAKRDIPWTKPEDLPIQTGEVLPQLGGHFEGLFLAAFVDGSVHTISSETAPDILWTYITKAQGEPPVPLDPQAPR